MICTPAKSQSKVKSKLKTNLSLTDKRSRTNFSYDKRKQGKFKFRDCVHHPKSNTHLSRHCTNPFGLRSAFGLAVSYIDKCNAVKVSVATGWSPKATNVQIPQGYGCDTPRIPNQTPNPVAPPQNNGTPRPLSSNVAAIPSPSRAVHPHQIQTYPRYQAMMQSPQSMTTVTSGTAHQHNHQPMHHGQFNPHLDHSITSYQQHGSPVRAYHTSVYPRQTLSPRVLPQPTQHHPPYPPQPGFHPPPTPIRTHMPAPIQANIASITGNNFPQPSQDDLIAAGMRYFATQTGMQDFQ